MEFDPIWARMARFFLALLALLFGLTLSGAPAEARVLRTMQVSVTAESSDSAFATQAPERRTPGTRCGTRIKLPATILLQQANGFAPSVLPGIDRARE